MKWLLLAFISLSAGADTGRLETSPSLGRRIGWFTLDVQISRGQMDYIKVTDSCYGLTASQSQAAGEVKGSGLLRVYSREVNLFETRTAGREIRGEGQLCVQAAQRTLNLIYRLVINDKIDGVPTRVNVDLPLQVALSDNEWAQYSAGQTVELELDAEGVRVLTESFAIALVNFARGSMLYEVDRDYSYIKAYIQPTLDRVTPPQSVRLRLDKDRATIQVDNYRVQATLKVGITT